MPYLVVDNFSAGLDSRRSALSSKDGTLTILKNAHITRGGEIEKRKAFAQFASLPANTFGLETTADKVYVFGSVTAPVMPSGVTYQRLQHPYSMVADMTKVVWSTVYGGLPFVIAEFADGQRFSYWDGAVIKDWHVGRARNHTSVATLASELAANFSLTGYTAVAAGSTVTITGPGAKRFTVTTQVTAPITATVTETQLPTEPVEEVKAEGSFLISGGSETRAYTRPYVRHIDAAALPGIRSVRVGASSATASDGQDLLNWTGTTGLKYNTYTVTDGYGSNGGALLWQLRKVINENTTAGLNHKYSARWASYGGWSGNDPAALWIDAPAEQGSNANGDIVQIEFDANPSGVYGIGELINPASIAQSPYAQHRYIATVAAGAMANGDYSRVESVFVDGINILSAPVNWKTSNSETSYYVREGINAGTLVHGYEAYVSNGIIKIKAPAGVGSAANNRTVSVNVSGSVIISQLTSMSGGRSYVEGKPNKHVVSILPATLANNPVGKISITVTDPEIADPYIFGASRVAGLSPNFAVTYKSKVHAGVGSTMYFSALNDATKWDIHDLGSGFIDMSNNFGGREDLTGFGVYQDKLAVFSRRNVQLWFLDADPAQNQQLQVLANTGCIAPDSVVSMGAIDLLYLADNGIRSLRARDGTDTAFASDIGSAIDSIVISHLATLTDAQKYAAKAVVEPVDGRYWLAVGDKIFVLSYFPGSEITAWSTYETGFTVSEFAAQGGKVFARAGNTIYLYGGGDGNTYDSSEVVVEFPYMDARKPAHLKRAKAMDLTIEGLWRAEMGFDHTAPGTREVILRASQSTFAFGTIPMVGIGTHFGLRMVNAAAGPAKVSNVIVHYDDMQPKHEAG